MLAQIQLKAERTIVGLMSGTSADGIDVALVKIEGGGGDAVLTLIAHDTLKYSPQVRQRILSCQGAAAGTAREITLLDAYLGELFAHAVLHICKKAGLAPEEVDAVGSNGQTLYHHPSPEKLPGFSVTGTLQIGNPSIIAERTGLTVVSHFRSRDMAVGGQGAPLAPLLDFALYRHRSRGRICVNLGGIANVTGLPAGAALSSLVAFDAGPGNCLVDMTAAHFSGGQLPYDRDGAWARAGRVNDALLAGLLEHPFLKLKPPKSADKEQFGRGLFQKVVSENPGMTGQDLAATFSAFTLRSLTTGLMEHLMQKDRYEEIIVSGGGSQNPYFMGGLGQAFPKLFVSSADEYAVPAQAKEAVLMALLANETLLGHPGNIPSATGAQRAVVLGVIAPGARAYADASKEGA